MCQAAIENVSRRDANRIFEWENWIECVDPRSKLKLEKKKNACKAGKRVTRGSQRPEGKVNRAP